MKLLMILLCKGTCAPIVPPFKSQGAVPPPCTPFPASVCSSTFNWCCLHSSLSELHSCIFGPCLAPPLALRPRKPPNSLNGSAGTDSAGTGGGGQKFQPAQYSSSLHTGRLAV